MATGRSDYPNQINNVLAFPGVFRGALDCRSKVITSNMCLEAAKAIASLVNTSDLNREYIIPRCLITALLVLLLLLSNKLHEQRVMPKLNQDLRVVL